MTLFDSTKEFLMNSIEKARKGDPIGTEKVWSGKTYVKTATGWIPKGKGKQPKEEEQASQRTKKVDYSNQASKAKDTQLQAAIKDKDASPEVKAAAQKELNARQGKTEEPSVKSPKVEEDSSKQAKTTESSKKVGGKPLAPGNKGIKEALQRILDAADEFDDDFLARVQEQIDKINQKEKETEKPPIDEKMLDAKLDSLKESMTQIIDKKLDELKGKEEQKQIKKTGLMIEGKKVHITLEGDTYVAKGIGETFKSKPGQGLSSFKEEVKEHFKPIAQKWNEKKDEKVESKPKEEIKEEKVQEVKKETPKVEESKKEEKVSDEPIILNGVKGSFVTITPKQNSFGKTQYEIEAFDGNGKKALMTNYQDNLEAAREKGNEMIKEIPSTPVVKPLPKKEEVKKELEKKIEEKKKEDVLDLNTDEKIWDKKHKLDKYLNEHGSATIDYKGKRFQIKDDGRTTTIKDLDKGESIQFPSNHLGPLVRVDMLIGESKTNLDFSNMWEAAGYQIGVANKEESLLGEKLKNDVEKIFSKYNGDGLVDEGLAKRTSNLIDNYEFDEIMESYSESDDLEKAQICKALVDKGYLPVANGLLFHSYEGNDYTYFNLSDTDTESYDDEDDDSSQDEVTEWYGKRSDKVSATKAERESIEMYVGMQYEEFRDYNENAKNLEAQDAKAFEMHSKNIDSFIDNNTLQDYVVLNRRMNFLPDGKNLNAYMTAKPGDTITDVSFTSFSLVQLEDFGNDMQVTLLAKPGDPIANVGNMGEFEYLAKRNSAYEVIARGTNSIVLKFAN
jgi:hypothetical protein